MTTKQTFITTDRAGHLVMVRRKPKPIHVAQPDQQEGPAPTTVVPPMTQMQPVPPPQYYSIPAPPEATRTPSVVDQGLQQPAPPMFRIMPSASPNEQPPGPPLTYPPGAAQMVAMPAPAPPAESTNLVQHVCAGCGKIRSSSYHHRHPIPSGGAPPAPDFCRRCVKEVTSSEGGEEEDANISPEPTQEMLIVRNRDNRPSTGNGQRDRRRSRITILDSHRKGRDHEQQVQIHVSDEDDVDRSRRPRTMQQSRSLAISGHLDLSVADFPVQRRRQRQRRHVRSGSSSSDYSIRPERLYDQVKHRSRYTRRSSRRVLRDHSPAQERLASRRRSHHYYLDVDDDEDEEDEDDDEEIIVRRSRSQGDRSTRHRSRSAYSTTSYVLNRPNLHERRDSRISADRNLRTYPRFTSRSPSRVTERDERRYSAAPPERDRSWHSDDSDVSPRRVSFATDRLGRRRSVSTYDRDRQDYGPSRRQNRVDGFEDTPSVDSDAYSRTEPRRWTTEERSGDRGRSASRGSHQLRYLPSRAYDDDQDITTLLRDSNMNHSRGRTVSSVEGASRDRSTVRQRNRGRRSYAPSSPWRQVVYGDGDWEDPRYRLRSE
ncbi:MAG: hypothetical protein M1825_002317 [Sarcosagium campestre]|nr:MAG: hypothetical protein M1825_002317 [Sarcosagium campestre]